MTKIGPKEARLAELRAANAVPAHVTTMLNDGAPLECIILPGEQRRASIAISNRMPPPMATSIVSATKTITSPPAKPVTQESTMKTAATTKTKIKTTKTKTKPKSTTTARRPAKAKSNHNARTPSADAIKKEEKFIALVTRPTGATFDEITKAVGWKVRKWLFGTAEKHGYALDLKPAEGRAPGHYIAVKAKK